MSQDELTPISADFISTLSRIETNVTRLVKVVEGNGMPGLVDRVANLETDRGVFAGTAKIRKGLTAFATSLIIALLGTSVSLMVVHNNHEDAIQAANAAYQLRQDDEIKDISVDVAVVMSGLKGEKGEVGVTGKPGKSGKTGTAGVRGVKGDRGGIKLFGK